MPVLVNIAPEDKEPVAVNIDGLTAFQEATGYGMMGMSYKEFKFYSAQEGQYTGIIKTANGPTRESVLSGLAAAGAGMLPVPDTMATDNPLYIRPEAFNYLIASKPVIPSGGGRLVIGADGFGHSDRSSVSYRAVEEFIGALAERQAELEPVDAGLAPSGFAGVSHIIINPRKIARIVPKDGNLDLGFESGWRMSLTFGKAGTEAVEDYARRLRDRLLRANPAAANDLGPLFRRAARHVNRERFRLRDEFIRQIAAKSEGLMRIEGTDSPFYARPGSIIKVAADGNKLTFTFRKEAGKSSTDTESATFISAERARQEMARLRGLGMTAPSA